MRVMKVKNLEKRRTNPQNKSKTKTINTTFEGNK